MKKDQKGFILMEMILGAILLLVVFSMIREKVDDDMHRVSVIIRDSDDGQWSAFKYGLKMAAQDLNVNAIVVNTGENEEFTVERQQELIENEIDNGADAVIVQPVPGAETEDMLKKMAKKVPLMLIESVVTEEDGNTNAVNLSLTEPDQYAMGQALAEEVLEDYNGNLNGKLIGLVMESEDSAADISRLQGLEDGLADASGKVFWTVVSSFQDESGTTLESKTKVDIVIALDDNSLVEAGKVSVANDLRGAVIYGIGNSMEAFYYLDTGHVKALIVPDAFNVGYQSLTTIMKKAGSLFAHNETNQVDYMVVRKDNLYSKEVQNILLTMSQ
ncbi:MAG: substrate-binding domain-containing protein [Clostridiales bacterium]|nr:substrate-binding domain-containing protein [Clostridiales bacterium]